MERSECPICPDWVVKCAHFPEPVFWMNRSGTPDRTIGLNVLTLHQRQGLPFEEWYVCVNTGKIFGEEKGHLDSECHHLSEFPNDSAEMAEVSFDNFRDGFLEFGRLKSEDL